MALVRFDPFRDIRALQNKVFNDRFFGFFDDDENGVSTRNWVPAVDVYENEAELGFSVELPGFDTDDIEISLNDGRLTISGERKFEEKEEGKFYRVERSYGKFFRSFKLPRTVDAEKITAKLKNGVLKVALPKKEEAKPKQIQVSVS